MNEKSLALEKIVSLMNDYNLSVSDISEATDSHEFDLMCYVNEKFVRLPYEQGKDKQVIGVFPFKDCSFYIDCDETRELETPFVLKNYLLSMDIWEDLARIKDKLNACLKSVGLPVLSGRYYTATYSNKYCIIDFSDGNKRTDVYCFQIGENKAKVRYGFNHRDALRA